jgi:copper chaperone CopZ
MKTLFRVFFLLTITFSLYLPGVSASGNPEQAQNPASSKQTIKVKVSGITCSGDSKDIQKSVGKINGIYECKLVGKASATSVFEITFNPSVVTEKEIRKAVEDTPGCENPDDRPYKVKS